MSNVEELRTKFQEFRIACNSLILNLADPGMTPSIHDHGTHYVINHKISLETLERIQKYTDVQEIKGKYSGSAASSGAAHERRERDHG
jgi:hypothetical protein